MSDARQDRLSAALTERTVFLPVLALGFVIIVALFGLFRSSRTLMGLLLMYAAFIGVLGYLIMALSDPFQGPLAVDADEFVNLIETRVSQG